MQQAEEGCKRCGSSAPRRGPSLFCEPCRNSLQEAGTCLRCGDHPLDRPRYCTQCRTLDNEKRQKAAAAKRSATPTGKVCRSCSRPADWSSRSHYCPECRANVKAQGLCARCGTNPLPEGRRFCVGCVKADVEKSRVKATARQAAGLCRCGADPIGGQKECSECRKRGVASLRRLRSKARLAGKCSHCFTAPRHPDFITCLDCSSAAAKRLRLLRLQVLLGYGSVCTCCGERRERFLEVDHVQRSWTGRRPPEEKDSPLYRRLIADSFPVGYQVLCINCNWSKRTSVSCTLLHGQPAPAWSSYLETASGRSARARLRLRIETLGAYGDQCACCGESDLQVLNLDHIYGGGNAERRSVGGGSSSLYQNLKRRCWPEGHRVLCLACNKAFHWLGNCPHQDPSLSGDVAAELAALTGVCGTLSAEAGEDAACTLHNLPDSDLGSGTVGVGTSQERTR